MFKILGDRKNPKSCVTKATKKKWSGRTDTFIITSWKIYSFECYRIEKQFNNKNNLQIIPLSAWLISHHNCFKT